MARYARLVKLCAGLSVHQVKEVQQAGALLVQLDDGPLDRSRDLCLRSTSARMPSTSLVDGDPVGGRELPGTQPLNGVTLLERDDLRVYAIQKQGEIVTAINLPLNPVGLPASS